MLGRGVQEEVGVVDQPVRDVKEDFFKIAKYTNGLSEFIQNCETPMTIAIQGDWGSGKTSFMNLIDNTLCEKHAQGEVKTIWFNTWAFSQFNLGDMLPINLLATLISTLDRECPEESCNSNQMILKLVKTAAFFASDIALSHLGTDVRIADFLDQNKETGEESLVDTIKNLRKMFEEKVQKFLDRDKKKKLVIFIDDLDRLPPQRAVEVLEVLKLFLECKNCVFVLAIDYMVVCKGIRNKYGEDMEETKGRSFFDKIIQVPFKMPVEHYDISRFLENSGIIKGSSEVIRQYACLIADSVGANPRAMKRLLNAFQLQMSINRDYANLEDEHERLLLFGVLCMQLSYEEWYRKLVENAEDRYNAEFFNRIRDNVDEMEDVFQGQDGVFQSFMSTFSDVLSTRTGAQIEKEDVDHLYKLLKMAGTTMSNNEQQPSFYETEEDLSVNKKITTTDVKYKILTFGSTFHIGFRTSVVVEFGGKQYDCKTHSSVKGRVDGLSKFYADAPELQAGDEIIAEYDHEKHIVHIHKKG